MMKSNEPEFPLGVLLPARLETRFIETSYTNDEGLLVPCWKLRVAVIPDDPWMNRHSDIISADEAACLREMWAECGDSLERLQQEAGRAPFRKLADRVGAARAWWLVTQFGPFGEFETGQKQLSRLDGLPDQIEIWLGRRQGQEITLMRLEPPLEVKKEALTFEGADGDGLNLFMAGRWWTEAAGLQQEYTLPFTTEEQLHEIEVVMAIGLGDDHPAELFAAHRNAGRLSLLPLGTPTNTVSGEPAADLAQDPDTWWRLLAENAEWGTVADVALALTGDKLGLHALPGGTNQHRRLNEELVSLLWPALWAHPLRDIWGVDRALDWRNRHEGQEGFRSFSFALGQWALANLHPEGPLPPLRIGDQPYGLWPVTRLRDNAWHAEDGDAEVEPEWLAQWLPPTRRQWSEAAGRHSGTVVGADTDRFVDLLGRVPSGSDYGYRHFLPLQVLHLLAHSQMGGQNIAGFDEWAAFTEEKINVASQTLEFPVRPVRRYMTTGWRQDLPLSLVEPPRATHLIGLAGGGLLFYHITTGDGASAALDESGNYRFNMAIPGFSLGWSHIIPLSHDQVLFYNTETGIGALARVDGEGNYEFFNEVSGMVTGWTHVTATPDGGILFYQHGTGKGLTAVLDGATRIKPVTSINTFSKGWTHIVAVNQSQLFFYNSADGGSAGAGVTSEGVYLSSFRIFGNPAGWTDVTATTDGEILFYNSATGESALATLDTNGNYHLFDTQANLAAGWTHLVYTSNGNILLYNAQTNTGASARIDHSDILHFLHQLPNPIDEADSLFFDQLERLLQIDEEAEGIAMLFTRHSDFCDPFLQTDSLLMRLIVNSLALLHAEIGRLIETMDFEGLPLIEPLFPDNFCTHLQEWCTPAAHVRFRDLLDDGAMQAIFERPDVADWPLIVVYRRLIMTLMAWRDAYHDALTQVEAGRSDAVRLLLADIERAFRAVLDTSATRIDPWVTGLAWRRLRDLRDQGHGAGLGLYAWVDRPFTGKPGPTAGGTLLAPSHAQLLTALIMRDKHIHDPQADRWQMDLDSQRIRQAQQFAREVRTGAHIQEVLGRAVEAAVGNKTQVERLRRQFPIRQEHAGRRVCDGQRLLHSDEGKAFLLGLGLSPAQQTKLQELRAITDTYGDLLVANAVHAVVSGRPEKAGETMDAAAGLELPPDLDLLRTPRRGRSVNTTVWLALPAGPPPAVTPDTSPAYLADAAVAAFLESAVPAGDWVWTVTRGVETQAVTLADLGLRVPEALAYSADRLNMMALDHAGGTAILEKAADGTDLSPALAAYHQLVRLAARLAGQVREVQNTDAQAARLAAQRQELQTRLEALRQAAQTLAGALDPDLLDSAALLRARSWGIAPAPLDDDLAPESFQISAQDKIKEMLRVAREILQDRLARVAELGNEATAQQLTPALAELSGCAMPIYGRAQREMLEEYGDLDIHETLDREWLETVAAVRPALARVEAHQLGAGPHWPAWCNRSDPWTPETAPGPNGNKRPDNLVVCYTPAGDLAGDLAVAVLDSWSEMIPDKAHLASAAFGFNAPSSRAPQAILLAVTPDESRMLDTETLAHIVLEARETAHARMATPADLAEFAALFPLAMVPAKAPTGVSKQQDQLV